MIKRLLKLATVAAAVTASGVVFAGMKISSPVYISYANGSNANAGYVVYASVGSARSSSDDMQYVGCTATTSASGTPYGYCEAGDATGKSVMCSFSSAAIAAAVDSINPMSYVVFFAEPSGVCSYVSVYQASYFQPAVP
jgi:hypothetical protein